MTSAASLKDWIANVQGAVTTLGIIIGGIWTYQLFVVERQSHPHAVVEEHTTRVPLTDDAQLVHVVIHVRNTGTTLLRLGSATARVQEVLPLDACEDGDTSCVRNELHSALSNTERTSDQFSWPLLGNRVLTLKEPRPIEPGEDDRLVFDFAVPADVRVVRVYGFVPNIESSGLGWFVDDVYDFRQSAPQGETP